MKPLGPYLLALLFANACRPVVRDIHSVPVTACGGKPFTLHWSLRGEAILSASHRPLHWDGDQRPVTGSGNLSVQIEVPTTFTLFAARAEPPDQSKEARVALVDQFAERSERATCGSDGTVRATLNLSDLAQGVRVRQIRNPVLAFPGGRTEPAELCVAHLGQSQCLKPGEERPFPALASSDWELTLPGRTFPNCDGAPSQLGMHFDFVCE